MATVKVLSEYIDRETQQRITAGREVDYPASRVTELVKRGLVEEVKSAQPEQSKRRGRKPKSFTNNEE